MSVTQSVCVFVALGIGRAMHMNHTVICGLPDYTVFSHIISQTARFCGKKDIDHKICVLISSASLFFLIFVLRITERDMVENVCWYSCKVPIFLFRF